MTASTPLRSASACHSSTASAPIRSTPYSASLSQLDPGKIATPILMSLRSASLLPAPSSNDLPLVLFYRRVGEEPAAHGVDLVGAFDLHLDEPSDVDGPDSLETKGRKRILHGFPLRVEDTGLRTNEDTDYQSTAPLCVISVTLRSISA